MKSMYSLLMIFIVLLSCSNNQQTNDPIPDHETFTILSKYVNEKRVINIILSFISYEFPLYKIIIDNKIIINE